MLWLVLVLVLVSVCGLWPQKVGTRGPCPNFFRVKRTRTGQGIITKNVIKSMRIKISSRNCCGCWLLRTGQRIASMLNVQHCWRDAWEMRVGSARGSGNPLDWPS